MKKEVWSYGFYDELIKIEEAIPVCGEDFCDRCGDCLHCYGDDECINGGLHRWVVYEPDLTP